MRRFRGDVVGIGGGVAVGHGRSQAPDGVDQHLCPAGVHRITREENPTHLGGYHLLAGHAHGKVVHPDALLQTVGNGPRGKKTGQHLAIGARQLLPADAQQAQILPRKRHLAAILADAAAAHCDQGREAARSIRRHPVVGLKDGGFHRGGYLRRGEQGLDAVTQRLEGLRPVIRQVHLVLVDLIDQFIVLQKGIEGRCGDGKPRRDRQSHRPCHLPQIGALAAHQIGHVTVDVREGQHPLGGAPRARLFDDGVDLGGDALPDRFQGGITPVGQFVQTVDHTARVEHRPDGQTQQIAAPEQGLAPELLLGPADQVEHFSIGFLQALKALVLALKEG